MRRGIAILENFETESANGRMIVNMMLTIAENEADRTSERIKFVFANKVSKGEAITGRVPIGYKIVDNRFQIDPEKAAIIRSLFEQYELLHSTRSAARYLYDTYGLDMATQSIFNILRNRIYIGYFRGNPNFCEPIITEEQFNRVQERLKIRSFRRNQTGQVYIFSGLLTCNNCGQRMAGQKVTNGGTYIYYKCSAVYRHVNLCTRKKRIREDWLENWLLSNVGAELENQRLEAEAKTRKQKQKTPDREAIMRKLNRLKDLYVNEVIDLNQYKTDYAKYTAQLAEANQAAMNQPRTPNYKGLQEKVAGIENFYKNLDTKERQAFWQGLIQDIRLDLDDTVHIFSSDLY